MRDEMLKIEEEELGFIPDMELPDIEDDSDSDSDCDDGELGGAMKQELFEDILGAINAFSEQYGGQTSYDTGMESPVKKQRTANKFKKKDAHVFGM